ncbi:MAG: putative secreted protein [Polyangiaceae bacterium]|nr:putative secreted protein [Polyangiaceae bacterium]
MTITRRLGMAMLLAAASTSLMGCSSSGQSSGGENESEGQLALPLVTQGASGVVYRLRDATFTISRYGWMGTGGTGWASGGGPGGTEVVTVSSETDPNAATISVNLEEGQYFVTLQPGWHFEKQTAAGYEEVEATLLYGETQYVYVSRQSTSFAEFQFGLGGREIWLNGDLNIGVVLYEDPSDLGYGGSGGFAGAGMGGWTAGSSPIPAGGVGGGMP